MSLFGKLRTVAPVIGGYAASILAAWAAKKGLAISDTEATAIVAGGGHVLAKIIAGAGVNPNDAAAPSLVRTGPVPSVYAPVLVGPNDKSPYIPPEPTPAQAQPVDLTGMCEYCGDEGGKHQDWCVVINGSGVVPDDTRTIRRELMRAVVQKMEAAVEAAMVPAPVEKSRILKPKPEPTSPPAPVTKKRAARAATVVKVGRRKSDAGNPNSERGDDE